MHRIVTGTAKSDGQVNERLLELPFDQYQRYRDVKEVVEQIREATGRPLKLLDVGGGEAGYLPAPDFFPKDLVIVADLHSLSLPNYVMAEGTRLPFADCAFDVAFSCDTLEHIPPDLRESFLRELFRVSRQCVVLVAPFRSPLAELAEHFVQEIFTAECGKPNQALLEHLEFGLPDVDDTKAVFSKLAAEYVSFPSGNLRNWLVMNAISFVFGSLSIDLYRAGNRVYNREFYGSDHSLPAYRTSFVAAKDETSAQKLAHVREWVRHWEGRGQTVLGGQDKSTHSPRTLPDLTSWLQVLRALKAVVRERDVHSENLGHLLRDRDAHIENLGGALHAKDVELSNLRETVQQKDVESTGLNQEIQSLRDAIAQRDRRVQELETWSHQVISSSGWHFLQSYYKLRDGVLPAGSQRRKIVTLGWRVLTRQPVSLFKRRWKDL